jgi:hypothetical protein
VGGVYKKMKAFEFRLIGLKHSDYSSGTWGASRLNEWHDRRGNWTFTARARLLHS